MSKFIHIKGNGGMVSRMVKGKKGMETVANTKGFIGMAISTVLMSQ